MPLAARNEACLNAQPCERLIHPSSAPACGRTPTVSGVLCNPPSTRMHSPKTPVAAHANESNTPSCTPHKQSESRPMAKHADMLAAPGCIPSRPEGITAFGADGSPESDRKKMQGALTYRLAGIHGANGRHLHRWPGRACGKCHHAGPQSEPGPAGLCIPGGLADVHGRTVRNGRQWILRQDHRRCLNRPNSAPGPPAARHRSASGCDWRAGFFQSAHDS